MQVSQADAQGCKRVGVEEHLIKFRPSPNFKNMKKFMKSKIDHFQITNNAKAAPDPTPPPNNGRLESVQLDIQPPLPLDPPPPDTPITLNMIVKQEVEDMDYASACDNSPAMDSQEHQENGETQIAPQEKSTNKTKMPVCRDFIRGMCNQKRQGTCRFVHKYDLSHLEGVYTFCHKYQNSVCTRTNCKYVHASVFEERHFYRTGILPPHALAHHKEVVQPPRPPLPRPPSEPQPDVPQLTFTNPPPPLHTEVDMTVLSVIPSNSLESRGISDTMLSQTVSPLKRDWKNIDPFGNSPCDIDINEHLPKKCKHCDLLEFRLQYYKEKVDKIRNSNEDMNKKMHSLEIKSDKLYTVLMALLKPQMAASKSQSHSNGLSLLSSDNKDKTLLEQLNTIMSVTSRLSTFGEDK